MNQETSIAWAEANQNYLMGALAEVYEILAVLLARIDPATMPTPAPLAPPRLDTASASMQDPPALENLETTFGLSEFERKVLLMCAGVELDSRFSNLYASAAKDLRHSLPTFSLALAAFEGAHWDALSPGRPLRYWHMVEVLSGEVLTTSPLRIDERVLHYLVGVSGIDERLRGLTEPLAAPVGLPESQQAVAEHIAHAWRRANRQTVWPVVQLCGAETVARRAVAAAACATLGLHLRVISNHVIPRGSTELDLFIRLWEREATFGACGLLLEFDELDAHDAAGEAAVNRLVETLRGPLLISARQRRRPVERMVLALDVPGVSSTEQVEIWKKALGDSAANLNGRVEHLASHFNLTPGSIYAAAAQALDPLQAGTAAGGTATDGVESGTVPAAGANDLAAALWDACRVQTRPRLEGLAQRIEPSVSWDDLVLPAAQKQLLQEISMQVRWRAKVYQDWGFAAKGARGLGISALFAGHSGTGKTMAAEVLASELRLDLYRIDLSQVVSKYIGETEKNLRRVFDAADEGASILLFDEADALFGKRSEVKDSHDRYANIEVSYLLQRMETYRGLAILTTNRKSALDSAFLRRIRFVVEFPFPEAAQRAEIWRRVFPRETPTEGLRIDRLARLNAAGGHIRNIAMGAAFLAAEADEPVRMSHLLAAARNEFAKLERPLTDSDVSGWV